MPEHAKHSHEEPAKPAAAAAPTSDAMILGWVDHTIEETLPDGTTHSIAVHSQGLVPANKPAPAQAPKPEATHAKS